MTYASSSGPGSRTLITPQMGGRQVAGPPHAGSTGGPATVLQMRSPGMEHEPVARRRSPLRTSDPPAILRGATAVQVQ